MSQSYVLDTNIVLSIIRGRELGDSIDRAFGLRTSLHRHIVSIVSHGELEVLAMRKQWGEDKRATLKLALSELVTLNLDSNALVEAYVHVEERCRRAPGGERKMGQNDMWIAATAVVAGLPLVTTDKDFDHLDGHLIQVHWVNPDNKAVVIQ